jgi:hypothetical protein
MNKNEQQHGNERPEPELGAIDFRKRCVHTDEVGCTAFLRPTGYARKRQKGVMPL